MLPKRIIIWGLKKRYHTHRHIHEAFYRNAKKLGYKTLWLEDEKKNGKYLHPGDLIITADVVGKMVNEKKEFEDYNLPVLNGVFYCLHNVKEVFKKHLNPKYFINLQVYNEDLLKKDNVEKWNEATYFSIESNTLYQPWGTDLLPHEFKEPIFNNNKFVFWIGSIWNDKFNRGNLQEIKKLKEVLHKNNLKFLRLRFIPNFLNIFLIRKSRIAPAISGSFQAEVNYLPCRMFKNISYGQLGITNVKKFKDILGDAHINGNSIEEIIENSLKLSKEEYLQKVKDQQELIKKYTYKNAIENIIKAIKQNYEK